GTIDKPGGTFDYYVRQLSFATFPWSAFLLGAVWQLASRASPLRSIADRRNLFIILTALLPYLFFTLSGTKFAHYIFPVVPFVCVMLAATLIWMMGQLPETTALYEPLPALGPPVPAHPTDE